MRDVEKLMNEYLASHLSTKVLQQLFKVVESAGMLKGSVMLYPQRQLIYETAFIFEAIVEATLQGIHINFIDAILDIYSENSDSVINRHFQVSQACRAYADSKLSQWGTLPTTDLLRINECIHHQDIKHLDDAANHGVYVRYSKPLNAFMEHIYGSAHHPYIRIVLMQQLSRTIETDYKIHPLTLEILCASLSHHNDIPPFPLNLAKHLLFRKSGMDVWNSIDDWLLQALYWIEQEISNMTRLTQSLENGRDLLRSKLTEGPFCKHIDDLSGLLQNSLCINNEMLSDALNTGAKTTIEYMKQLEACKLVSGHKCGRKKLYVNRHLQPIITEAILHG